MKLTQLHFGCKYLGMAGGMMARKRCAVTSQWSSSIQPSRNAGDGAVVWTSSRFVKAGRLAPLQSRVSIRASAIRLRCRQDDFSTEPLF